MSSYCALGVRPIVTLPHCTGGTGSDVSHKMPSYRHTPWAHMGPHTHTCPCVHSRTAHVSKHTCGHLTHTCAATTAHRTRTHIPAYLTTHRGARGHRGDVLTLRHSDSVGSPGPPRFRVSDLLGPQPAALLAEVSHGKGFKSRGNQASGRPLPPAPARGTDSCCRSSSRTRARVTGAGHPVPVYSGGVYTPMSCIIHTLKPTLACVGACTHTPCTRVRTQSPHTRAWGHGVCSDAMMSHNPVHSGLTLP